MHSMDAVNIIYPDVLGYTTYAISNLYDSARSVPVSGRSGDIPRGNRKRAAAAAHGYPPCRTACLPPAGEYDNFNIGGSFLLFCPGGVCYYQLIWQRMI